MTLNEYENLAMRTNDGSCCDKILEAINLYDSTLPLDVDPGELLNGALGLTGEAGEVADMVKKHIFHKHQLDRFELVKELGDVCWYLALICHALNVSLEEVMDLNVKKLKERYPNGFSVEASINRKM